MAKLEAAPLYQKVTDVLIGRIGQGQLAPGDALPSEFELAAELGVSQGTVRKALGSLESRRIIERRQGRGTYVAETTPESELYHFYRLRHADGSCATPEPGTELIGERPATGVERALFEALRPERVFVINRARKVAGRIISCETMILPAELVPGLPDHAPLPNALYAFYQETYGINILRAEEQLAAKAAGNDDARKLGIHPAAPVLVVERRGFDIADRVVEYRHSRYLTDDLSYRIELS